MLPEEVEGEGSQNRHMNQSMTVTERGRIFLQDDIFAPVQAIFNMPMLPDAPRKFCGISSQRTDIKHRL